MNFGNIKERSPALMGEIDLLIGTKSVNKHETVQLQRPEMLKVTKSKITSWAGRISSGSAPLYPLFWTGCTVQHNWTL